MPRVSRKQTERNRIMITDTAARLFKERGIRAISLSEIMGSVGLTLGGFYGHFESKDALAIEACAQAFMEAAQTWKTVSAERTVKAEARSFIVLDYLSQSRRDRKDNICPVVAFTSEVVQDESIPKIREIYVEGLESIVHAYQQTLEDKDFSSAKKAALVDYSLMVGALMLARAAGTSALSDEILTAAKDRLLG